MLRGEDNIKMDFKEIRFDVSSIPFLLFPQKFKLCDCFTYILPARHKMQEASFSKMMVHIYQFIHHHISSDWNVHTLDDFIYLH
jgi:hypothetical protein